MPHKCHGSPRRAGGTLAKRQKGWQVACYPVDGSTPFQIREQTMARAVQVGNDAGCVVALNFNRDECYIRDCRRGNANVKCRILTMPIKDKQWRSVQPALEWAIRVASGMLELEFKWSKDRITNGWETFFHCQSDIGLSVKSVVEKKFPDARLVDVPVSH